MQYTERSVIRIDYVYTESKLQAGGEEKVQAGVLKKGSPVRDLWPGLAQETGPRIGGKIVYFHLFFNLYYCLELVLELIIIC